MSTSVGILIFSRHDSRRLPGKALRLLGGIPLLERVIMRAQLCRLPVYLATTEAPSDDALVAVADALGVEIFRGSSERVLERAVLAAEAFGLDAFVRLCGDRPLFPLDDMREAVAAMRGEPETGDPADLVTTFSPGETVRGLTTEVVRTATLRDLLDRGPSRHEQEHVTPHFYEHPEKFRIVRLPVTPTGLACPSFALDTELDLHNLERIFAGSNTIDLSPAEADRIYRT